MRAFKAPDESLGRLNATMAASVIEAASDIALVVDGDGVICDLSITSEELSRDFAGGDIWFGCRWLDTVTKESRPKVEALIQGAIVQQPPRWRHVNHITRPGDTVPILYSAMRLGDADRAIALGRDLRPLSRLQQRLVEAQQSVEREYSRLRQAETRYRLLFHVSPEPVLIADAVAGRVLELNPAAERLLGRPTHFLLGRPVTEVFDQESKQTMRSLLALLGTGSRAEETTVTLAEGGQVVRIAASVFLEAGHATLLLRLLPLRAELKAPTTSPRAGLLTAVEHAPDGFVVTNDAGQILTVNDTFLDLAQLGAEDHAIGEPLGRWLGHTGGEMNVLTSALRQHGAVRLFSTAVRGEYGASTEVEVSATSVLDGSRRPSFGFAIRNVTARLPALDNRGSPPSSMEDFKQLIGRMPLKELVRQATDLIERLSIEAALEISGDSRARAAEVLGLSRQSLYAKLHRHGFGGFDEGS
ncbi:transcriptional regulator PpsR [Paracraurococcus ruber]|uniref:Transcriptional regulator PpsR n=1 Tax=Paracraurococcus ruber TaxID=77675 RepID=A0ABS1D7G5_9PROT|nr:transcriptional regulator PpsR [Paracraurococcus ruber]MBK1662012.1 transcriptional regulator PpsR [Paracraurococcus ruber]TDG16368.1 transcriptional regulator PpsR [Paracraurococcus ruber]